MQYEPLLADLPLPALHAQTMALLALSPVVAGLFARQDFTVLSRPALLAETNSIVALSILVAVHGTVFLLAGLPRVPLVTHHPVRRLDLPVHHESDAAVLSSEALVAHTSFWSALAPEGTLVLAERHLTGRASPLQIAVAGAILTGAMVVAVSLAGPDVA